MLMGMRSEMDNAIVKGCNMISMMSPQPKLAKSKIAPDSYSSIAPFRQHSSKGPKSVSGKKPNSKRSSRRPSENRQGPPKPSVLEKNSRSRQELLMRPPNWVTQDAPYNGEPSIRQDDQSFPLTHEQTSHFNIGADKENSLDFGHPFGGKDPDEKPSQGDFRQLTFDMRKSDDSHSQVI